jgi:hypothetical protein
MSIYTRCCLSAVLLAPILAGCGGDDPQPPQTNGGTGNGNGHRPGPIDIDPTSIQVTDWAGVEQIVAAHQGEVVIVYLWATFNQPSVNEFSQLVRLCREHENQLHCVSVNLDYAEGGEGPEALRDSVAEFAGKHGADFDHVVSQLTTDQLYTELGVEAGIPIVYVYNRQGELAKRFDNEDPDQPEFSFRKDVVPYVEELLTAQ